jgi:hypothetical protein
LPVAHRGRAAKGEFLPEEVDKIAAYLKNGGRLLALLTKPCGLEPVLANNGASAGQQPRALDKDPELHSSGHRYFLDRQLFPHPIMNPLAKDKTPILMVWPRPLYPVEARGKVPGAPEVSISWPPPAPTGWTRKTTWGTYFLLAAIEQGVIKGVDTPRGGGTASWWRAIRIFWTTRSSTLSGNHDFA